MSMLRKTEKNMIASINNGRIVDYMYGECLTCIFHIYYINDRFSLGMQSHIPHTLCPPGHPAEAKGAGPLGQAIS